MHLHILLFSMPGFWHHWRWLLFPVFIGCTAGLLAQTLLPGRGFGLAGSFSLGIAGAWLGSKFLTEHLKFIEQPLLKEICSATAGAMILAFVINLIRGGKDRDKTAWRHN